MTNYGQYCTVARGAEILGERWTPLVVGSKLKKNQLDAGFLVWDIRRFVQLDQCPSDQRVVIHFYLRDTS